jgi:hypothetical protein
MERVKIPLLVFVNQKRRKKNVQMERVKFPGRMCEPKKEKKNVQGERVKIKKREIVKQKRRKKDVQMEHIKIKKREIVKRINIQNRTNFI